MNVRRTELPSLLHGELLCLRLCLGVGVLQNDAHVVGKQSRVEQLGLLEQTAEGGHVDVLVMVCTEKGQGRVTEQHTTRGEWSVGDVEKVILTHRVAYALCAPAV